MSFPVIATVNGGDSGGNTTSHSINMPSGITAGDLLIVLFSCNDNPTTSMSGWNLIYTSETSGDGLTMRASAYYKIAVGSDTGTITTSTSRTSCHKSMRITGHGGYAPTGTTVVGNSTTPNPTTLTPGEGNETNERLWLATAHTRRAAITAYPSSPDVYSGGSGYNSGTSGTGTGAYSAYLQEESISENPGAFTDDGSNNIWIAGTIQIEGIYVPPEPIQAMNVEGFEAGADVGAESQYIEEANGILSFSTSQKASGGYSLRCQSAGATNDGAGILFPMGFDDEGVPITDDAGRVSLLFRLRIASAPTTQVNIFYMTGPSPAINFMVDSSLNLKLHTTTVATLSLNTWYTIAIGIESGSPSYYYMQAWNKEMSVMLGEASYEAGVNDRVETIYLGNVVGGVGANGVDLYIDDLVVERDGDSFTFPLFQQDYAIQRMSLVAVDPGYTDWSAQPSQDAPIAAGGSVYQATADINPGELDMSTSAKHLWVSYLALADHNDYNDAPSGYTGAGGGGASGVAGARLAHRQNESDTENPPAWDTDAGSGCWTGTIGIRPREAGTFPSVVDAAGGNGSSNTSHTINLPGSIEAGDFLLCLFSYNGATTTPTFTGWTTLVSHSHFGSVGRAIYYKIADGSEGATDTLTTAAARTSAHAVQRIRGVLNFAALVNEIPVTSTETGIKSTTASDQHAFIPDQDDLDDLLIDSVLAMKVATCFKVSAGNTSRTAGLEVDGTEDLGDPYTHATTDPQRFERVFQENPDTAAAWTRSTLYDARPVVENTSYASGTKYVLWVAMQFAYKIPTPRTSVLGLTHGIIQTAGSALGLAHGIDVYAGSALSMKHAYLRELFGSDLGLVRSIITTNQSAIGFKHAILKNRESAIGITRSILRLINSHLAITRRIAQVTKSDLKLKRSLYIRSGYHIYYRNVETEATFTHAGFIDATADPLELSFAMLPDGEYEILVTVQGYHWDEHTIRSRKRVTIGGSAPTPTSLPIPSGLDYKLLPGLVRLSWQLPAGFYTTPEDFGIWTGPTSPVSVAGAPESVVTHDGAIRYHATITHSGAMYAAVAARSGASPGVPVEISIPEPVATPTTPLNQRAEHADLPEEAL